MKFEDLDYRIKDVRVGRVIIGSLVGVLQTVLYEILSRYNILRFQQDPSSIDVSISLDSSIPLIPEMAWIYFIYIPALIIPAFLDISFKVFVRYCMSLAMAVSFSCLLFYLLPIKIIHPEFSCSEFSCAALAALYNIDQGMNIFPSLHASQSSLAIIACFYSLQKFIKIPVGVYLSSLIYLPIIASTLLTRQHFTLDLFAGFIMAVFCWLLSRRVFKAI